MKAPLKQFLNNISCQILPYATVPDGCLDFPNGEDHKIHERAKQSRNLPALFSLIHCQLCKLVKEPLYEPQILRYNFCVAL